MKRLHPPSHKAAVDKQVSLLWSLVKMSRLHFITPWQGRKPLVLSEELLLHKSVKRRLASSLTIFLPEFGQKKWSGYGDSNSGPFDPQSNALDQAALYPEPMSYNIHLLAVLSSRKSGFLRKNVIFLRFCVEE